MTSLPSNCAVHKLHNLIVGYWWIHKSPPMSCLLMLEPLHTLLRPTCTSLNMIRPRGPKHATSSPPQILLHGSNRAASRQPEPQRTMPHQLTHSHTARCRLQYTLQPRGRMCALPLLVCTRHDTHSTMITEDPPYRITITSRSLRHMMPGRAPHLRPRHHSHQRPSNCASLRLRMSYWTE